MLTFQDSIDSSLHSPHFFPSLLYSSPLFPFPLPHSLSHTQLPSSETWTKEQTTIKP